MVEVPKKLPIVSDPDDEADSVVPLAEYHGNSPAMPVPTVPEPPPPLVLKHTPAIATQPPYGRLMPAIVEVAVVDADVNESGDENEDVAVPVTVNVPVAIKLARDRLPENRALP